MTLKNRSRIFAIITAMLISIAFMPVSTSGAYANTTDEIANENNVDDNADIVEEGEEGQDSVTVNVMGSEDIVYEKLDDTYHCYTDSNGETIKEEHDWSRCASPEYVDEDYHKVTYTCDKCGATLSWNDSHCYEDGPSEWFSYEEEEYGDAYYEPTFVCECGDMILGCVDEYGHEWEDLDDDESLYKKYNSTYHCLVTERCTHCGALKGFLVRHDDYEPCYYKYSKVDAKYHNLKKCCYDCGVVSTKKEKHSKAKTKVVKKATFKKKGKIQDICKCGAVIKTRTVSWKYNTKYSVSYNVTWNTYVYRNSKHITVTLKNPVKGSTVIVQIGNKKYKKKVGKGKKVKIKIKKPKKYGKKIYIDVKYKGKWIGEAPYYDVVYYAKNIKKGMTKKQFKHTVNYWGSPDDTASASGGWTYWYYNDGSYIGFKNGKVKYWYDAD